MAGTMFGQALNVRSGSNLVFGMFAVVMFAGLPIFFLARTAFVLVPVALAGGVWGYRRRPLGARTSRSGSSSGWDWSVSTGSSGSDSGSSSGDSAAAAATAAAARPAAAAPAARGDGDVGQAGRAERRAILSLSPNEPRVEGLFALG